MSTLFPKTSQALNNLAHWIRESTSKENLLAGLKTLSWLVPLTLLIWVYAEREQIYTTPEPGETIPIKIHSTDPNRFVDLRMTDKNVLAQLSGPRSLVEEIRGKIEPQGDQPTVVISVGSDLPIGQTSQLDTAQRLMASPIFARSGITVSNCQPAHLPVFVDEYQEKEVEVEAPPDVLLKNLNGTPVFTPAKVTVRAPKSHFNDVGDFKVYANFPSSELTTPGHHEPIIVSVSTSKEIDDVTFSPATVTAAFEVRAANKTGTLDSVPIWVLASPLTLAKAKVQCDLTLAGVPIIGPAEEVDKLLDKNHERPVAVLTIQNDTRDVPHQGTLSFKFPSDTPNVQVAPEFSQKTITYTLTDITSP